MSTSTCHFFALFLIYCLWILLSFNSKSITLCVSCCAVRRHHRANLAAGGLPAVGSAAAVVVLASLLHSGKFTPHVSAL